jgi:hypothetical protein
MRDAGQEDSGHVALWLSITLMNCGLCRNNQEMVQCKRPQ